MGTTLIIRNNVLGFSFVSNDGRYTTDAQYLMITLKWLFIEIFNIIREAVRGECIYAYPITVGFEQ
jgi:hypothetical protein